MSSFKNCSRVTPLQNRKSVKPSAQKRLNLNVQPTTIDIHKPSTSSNNNGTLTCLKEGGPDDQVNGRPTLDIRSKENVHVDGIPSHATHDLKLNPLVNGRPTQENDPKQLWSAPTNTQSKTEQINTDQLNKNNQTHSQTVKNDPTTDLIQLFMKQMEEERKSQREREERMLEAQRK